MRNFPFKAINPDTGQWQTFWYSRSMAAAIFVFAPDKRGDLCVLANKRGPGCPDFIGYWCCPCGYLDYDETLKEAAVRECKEETGVILPIESVKFAELNDDPKDSNHQNVTARFYATLESTTETSNSENEEEETSDIRWIPVNKISDYEWAFGHGKIIEHILNDYKI